MKKTILLIVLVVSVYLIPIIVLSQPSGSVMYPGGGGNPPTIEAGF